MITGDPALIAAAAALRHEVFVVGQGVPAALEADEADRRAVHSVVLEAGQVVATGRLVEEGTADDRHARLGRIAVRPDRRQQGLGAQVVADLTGAAAARGLPTLVLHAQEPVVAFYRRLGWQEFGPPDVEAGIAHRWMRRELLPGLRPVRDPDAPALQALIGACFAEYPGCVLELDGLDAWMRRPGTRFAAGGELWVVPAAGGGLAACCGWIPTPDGVELKSLYVAAGSRRAGLGTALAGLVERRARDRGATAVRLWSDSRFTDAHRLYRRLGYSGPLDSRALHDASRSTEFAFAKELGRPC